MLAAGEPPVTLGLRVAPLWFTETSRVQRHHLRVLVRSATAARSSTATDGTSLTSSNLRQRGRQRGPDPTCHPPRLASLTVRTSQIQIRSGHIADTPLCPYLPNPASLHLTIYTITP